MTTRFLPLALGATLACLPLLSMTRGDSGEKPSAEALRVEALPEFSKVAGPRQEKELSNDNCASCHKRIHDEWKSGKHAQSWTSEIYQAAIKKKRKPSSCHSCHIPNSVLARLPKKPKARKDKSSWHAGITCVACHVNDGKVHGPFGAETDAHESVKSEHFSPKSSDLCLACHSTKIGPVLPVGRDFLDAGYAKRGRTCLACHFKKNNDYLANDEKSGKPVGKKRRGRSHALRGPSTKGFLQGAFHFHVQTKDGKTMLLFRNRAAHRIPALRIRRFAATVRGFDADGKEVWKKEASVTGKDPIVVKGALEIEAPSAATRYKAEVRHFLHDGKKERDLGVVFRAEFPKPKKKPANAEQKKG